MTEAGLRRDSWVDMLLQSRGVVTEHGHETPAQERAVEVRQRAAVQVMSKEDAECVSWHRSLRAQKLAQK